MHKIKLSLFTVFRLPSTFYLSTLLLFTLLSNSYCKTPHTIVVDGVLNEWTEDEIVYIDSENDSAWGVQNDVHKLYLTWDEGYLYLGVAGVQKDGNNLIVYIDSDLMNGVTDVSLLKNPENSNEMWWWRRNNSFTMGFTADFQWHLYEMGLRTDEGHGFFKINTDYTTENKNSYVTQKSSGGGTGKYGEAELKIPWNILYNKLGFPNEEKLRIVVCITGGMDTKGTSVSSDDEFGSAHDTIPDQNNVFTSQWSAKFEIDSWLTVNFDNFSNRSPITRNVSLEKIDTTSVKVSWEKRKKSEFADYFNVCYSTDANIIDMYKITKITSTECNVTGLTTSLTYYFVVASVKNNIESYSETVILLPSEINVISSSPQKFLLGNKDLKIKIQLDTINIQSSTVTYRINNLQWDEVYGNFETGFLTFNIPKTKLLLGKLEWYLKITKNGRHYVFPDLTQGYYQIALVDVLSYMINDVGRDNLFIIDEKKYILFPKNSLGKPEEIKIKNIDKTTIYENEILQQSLPVDVDYIESIYQIYSSSGSISFNSPVEVKTDFSVDILPLNVKPENITVMKYVPDIGVREKYCQVDTQNKTVKFYINDTGIYLVVAKSVISKNNKLIKKVYNSKFIPGRAKLEFELDISKESSLKIFSLDGILINETKPLFTDTQSWDGKDMFNNIVPPGVYVYQLKIADEVLTGTTIVIR